jgi:hypothetical protein
MRIDTLRVEAPMKVKAKLRYMDARGETTNTQWGDVTFDRDGLAELEVPEEDLQLLRNLRWLVEKPAEVQEPPPLPGLPLEHEEAPPASASPDDTVTPPQGSKKRGR